MSEAVQVALIVAVGPLLLGILSHISANRKLNHITVLTNSTLSDANKLIQKQDKIIEELRTTVGRLEILLTTKRQESA